MIRSNQSAYQTKLIILLLWKGQNTPRVGNLTINIKGVEKLLQNLKINKESGPDDLSAYILNEAVTELAPVLTVIFNQSLNIDTLHEDQFQSNIGPIFKKRNKNMAKKYRHASITHMYMLQSHGTYNMQAHTRTPRSKLIVPPVLAQGTQVDLTCP